MSIFSEPRNVVKSVGILMVATNSFMERWKVTALDLEKYAFRETDKVSIHLFTNEVIAASQFANSKLQRINLVIHKIEGWGWPEATLFRYKFFDDAEIEISEEFLIYLDSDMRVTNDLNQLVLNLTRIDGIGVVSHPGYFRGRGLQRLKFYLGSPAYLLKDLKLAFRSSRNLGAWETNRKSTAYVPRKFRKIYVHGAIWFGFRENLLSMCKSLRNRTEIDYQQGRIARWHDESHLNWYVTGHAHKTFDNRLSWVEGYRNLNSYAGNYIVSTVQKEIGEGREPSNV